MSTMDETRQLSRLQRLLNGHLQRSSERFFDRRCHKSTTRTSQSSCRTSAMSQSTFSFMHSSAIHDPQDCSPEQSSLQKKHSVNPELSKEKRTRPQPWKKMLRFLRRPVRTPSSTNVAQGSDGSSSSRTNQPETSSLATSASLCTFASKFEQVASENLSHEAVQALVDLPSLRGFDHGSISERRVYDFVWEYTQALTLAAAYQSRAAGRTSSKSKLTKAGTVNHPKWNSFWKKYHTSDFGTTAAVAQQEHQEGQQEEENGSSTTTEQQQQEHEHPQQDHPQLKDLASWLQQHDIQDYAQDTLAVDTIKLIPGQDAAIVIFKTQQSYTYQEGACSSSTRRCFPRIHTPLIHHEVDQLVTWTAALVQDDFTGNLQVSSLRRTTQESTILA